MSSSRYNKLFKYSWFKSGYTNERPEEFENPVEFSFDKSSTTCDLEDCSSNIAVVRCLVQEVNIFKTFFHHYYNEYINGTK